MLLWPQLIVPNCLIRNPQYFSDVCMYSGSWRMGRGGVEGIRTLCNLIVGNFAFAENFRTLILLPLQLPAPHTAHPYMAHIVKMET